MESTRDTFSAFFIGNGLTESFVNDEFEFTVYPLRRTFREIDSKDEFWQWCRGPFTQNLYPPVGSRDFPRYWNGKDEVDHQLLSVHVYACVRMIDNESSLPFVVGFL